MNTTSFDNLTTNEPPTVAPAITQDDTKFFVVPIVVIVIIMILSALVRLSRLQKTTVHNANFETIAVGILDGKEKANEHFEAQPFVPVRIRFVRKGMGEHQQLRQSQLLGN